MTFAPRSHPGASPASGAGSRGDATTPNPQVGRSATLTIRGVPTPKGSRTIGRRRDGSAFTRPAAKGEAAWIEVVAREAIAARVRFGAIEPPYSIGLDFSMPRPARPSHRHPTRADLDKLIRAVLDGLTRAALIADDRHVIELVAWKHWAQIPDGEGVSVSVRSIASGGGRVP